MDEIDKQVNDGLALASRSEIAAALGKFGKGKKKTMSKEAIEQRRNAAKRKRIRVCQKSIVKDKNSSRHESVSVV